ncbi:MAG: hypothetical protein HWN65_10560 [Candidatus Helarchaeota archaeon]|nr:hypothetical protein [Candidatus Helarchaeota archaeon]
MEQGDKLGLVGMILGISAASNIVLYFVFSNIPLYQAFWGLFMIIFYATIYGGGSVGLILSIIGTSKSGSKFGIIGIITSAIGIGIFSLVLFGFG